MKALLARYMGPCIGLTLFIAALWVLHRALAAYRYQDVIAALERLPGKQLFAALLCTALSYLITTGYDWLALRYIRHPLPWPKVGFAALISYAISNSVGLSVLTSSSLRYRLYSSWGLTTVDIARIILFTTLTLWLGILTMGGAVLALNPLDLRAFPHLVMNSRLLPAAPLLGALLAYRLIYYLLPLALAALALGLYELRHQKERILWLPRLVGPWAPVLLPQVFALLALISGAVLLFSAVTPAVEARLAWLEDLVPLSVLEASHFVSSLLGMSLLLLARGLQRRLDAAWLLAVLFLGAGIAASLLKGADYEEAMILTVLLAGLLPSRREFYRRASLLGESFTPGWVATILVVLVCAAWLGIFSYRHVEYSRALWWDFSFGDEGGAPRSLRALVGALGVVLFFGVAKLLRPARFEPSRPGPDDLQQAQAIAAAFPRSYAHLALLGDKALLFNEARDAFLMYGVAGRAWVAMGDPVAACEELSVDLMRYPPDSPNGLMDYLFIQIMLWGRAQGYEWFNLGMAPLAGLQNRNLAPLWNRFGAMVFGGGEAFYNFRGLHQYKDKFNPRWEARYLAAPGGLALPWVLTDLTTLIAGGVRGVISK
ncbi:MAG: mprF [Proteobacteria bacterium]|nr:mprF [Pseudomonadota bacterium]